jgi:hypothetical protein
MAQKVCLGVEISQNELKLALVEPKRKKVIKIDSVPTSGNSMLDTSIYASVVGSWVRSKLIPKIESVAVAFPASNSIIRAIAIPKEEENPSAYVKWEFESAVNSSAGSYKINTFYFPDLKNPKRAVVCGLGKSIVDSFLGSELQKSGFKPDSLMVDLFTLFNLLECSEGLGSAPKCILKADEISAIAFWVREDGILSTRFLPKDCISAESVIDILESGFSEFPRAKRVVKLCGELAESDEFAEKLASCADRQREPLKISLWSSVPKFSFAKGEDFSKLPRCLGAVGATLNCI